MPPGSASSVPSPEPRPQLVPMVQGQEEAPQPPGSSVPAEGDVFRRERGASPALPGLCGVCGGNRDAQSCSERVGEHMGCWGHHGDPIAQCVGSLPLPAPSCQAQHPLTVPARCLGLAKLCRCSCTPTQPGRGRGSSGASPMLGAVGQAPALCPLQALLPASPRLSPGLAAGKLRHGAVRSPRDPAPAQLGALRA